MDWSFIFFLNAALLGVGLAMDAFSVSCADALAEPDMKAPRMTGIALTFGLFQTAMPLIGWVLVHAVAEKFAAFQKFIPWIALALLLYIGGKMLLEGLRYKDGEGETAALSFWTLMLQGVATAIDALSVGFTIADLGFVPALCECLIIGAVTFLLCLVGLVLGKKLGTRLSGKASILGGVILIAIGIEIFVKGVFF